MNNKYITSFVWLLIISVLSIFTFNACSSDDEFSTEQYKGGISLNVFGPCPVARGGELRFLGSGMNSVTGIVIPGCEEIKNIKKINNNEIRVEVPQTAEVGFLTLNVPNGKITTKTQISYSEPISLDGFSPSSVKAGDEITVTGEYLNLIKEIIFADNVSVTEDAFISHSRNEIKLIVPIEAQTGKIIISDGNPTIPNWIYSNEVLNVTLPTCSAVTPTSQKAGNLLTFVGTDMNLVKGIAFNGCESEEIEVNKKDNKSLVCKLPEEATDGDVSLICYSGVKVLAGKIETIVPTNLSIASSDLKNGKELIVKGKDMDLIKSVSMPNVTDEIELKSTSTTVTINEIPELAQSGDIIFKLLNGKEVKLAYKLVEPKVTSFSPSTIMAGNTTTIKGTNLDLVAKVLFKGDGNPIVEKFISQSSTAIELTVPSSAEQGIITLQLKNGTEVEINSGLTIKPATDPVISTMPETTSPGHYVLITGKNLNTVENFYLGTTKMTSFEERSANRVEFKIPSGLSYGDYKIKMVNFEGKTFESENTLKVQSPEFVIVENSSEFNFPFDLGSWTNAFRIYRNTPVDFSKLDIKIGSTIYLYVNAYNAFSQIKLNDANWNGVALPQLYAIGETKIAVPVDNAILEALLNISDGWSQTALICHGEGMIVNKVTILP